ncbi:hypothetical protein MMC19_007365 [Ptychographa xylographoides]|nr:hypothetical protein [Ptychographa xylographoides]
MQFCAAAGRDGDALDQAFASLSLQGSGGTSLSDGVVRVEGTTVHHAADDASRKELFTILAAMRKLREAIVASSRTDSFAQRAYVFIIRASILTSSYESYHPALLHLLSKIHPLTPLPPPELHEFVAYHILDVTCRLGDYAAAFVLRKKWALRDDRVEGVLRALVHDNWVDFWRLRDRVDGYQRNLISWADDGMRKHALKCLGRGYLSVDKKYVERCAGRSWQELKRKDNVGWGLDGDTVTVRRIKAK